MWPKSLSTQNRCRRQLIIHEVCVLDLNRTSFSMATRGSTLGNFGYALVRLCHCLLSEAMQIKTYERLWNCKKNICYFQTNWPSCILNWGVRCDVVSDASHACCSFLLLTWRTSLTTKIEVSVRQQIQFLDSSNNKFHIWRNICTKGYFFCIVNRKGIMD